MASDASQALARIRELRLQLLVQLQLPRSVSDERHARMEEGEGAGAALSQQEQEEEEEGSDALDGLLEAMRSRAEVQTSQAQALVDGWEEEVGQRRKALLATTVQAQASREGNSSEEADTAVWALLADRLTQLGLHRLASALRESDILSNSLSRPGSSCCPSPAGPSRLGSAASFSEVGHCEMID